MVVSSTPEIRVCTENRKMNYRRKREESQEVDEREIERVKRRLREKIRYVIIFLE